MLFDRDRLLADLDELRRRDPQFELFGAADHRYALHKCLTESRVSQFEQRHSIRLPEDYRQFLIEIGNGGAGPHYGVFRLGEMDNGWKLRRWREGDGFIGDLSAPFPHTRRWNKRPRLPRVDEDHPDFEKHMEEYDRIYWDPANVNGAIPLCNLGCALRVWLVISGREAGHVWKDERTDDGGLSPLSTLRRRRFTFHDWYRQWLSNSLRETGRKIKVR
jgi:hypothetical protein